MLFGEALDEYLQSRRCDATLKPRTKAYDEQQVVALLKTWPGLRELDIRRIGKEDCEFGNRYDKRSFHRRFTT